MYTLKDIDNNSSEELRNKLKGWGYVSDGNETHGRLVYEAMCMLGSGGLLEKHDAELLSSQSFFRVLTGTDAELIQTCSTYAEQYSIRLSDLNRVEWIYLITGSNADGLCADLDRHMVNNLYESSKGRLFENTYFLPQLEYLSRHLNRQSGGDYVEKQRRKAKDVTAAYFAERIRDVYPLVTDIKSGHAVKAPVEVRNVETIFQQDGTPPDKYEAKLTDLKNRLSPLGIYLNGMTPKNTYFDSQDRLWILSTIYVSFERTKSWDMKWKPLVPIDMSHKYETKEEEEEDITVDSLPTGNESREPIEMYF